MEAYLDRTAKQDLVTRKTSTEKTGSFTGSYAINPATGQEIPVWIADYVLMEYGTGAIMAVPAHDDRDFEFATLFGLPIVRVVCAESDDPTADVSSPFTGGDDAKLLNSGGSTTECRRSGSARSSPMLAEKAAANGGELSAARLVRISREVGVRRFRSSMATVAALCQGREGPPVVLPYSRISSLTIRGIASARHEDGTRAVSAVRAQGRRETDVSDTFLDSACISYAIRVGARRYPFDNNLTKNGCRRHLHWRKRARSAAPAVLALSRWCS